MEPATTPHDDLTAGPPLDAHTVVSGEAFDEARRDARVRAFHEAADVTLAELEAAGRVLY